MISLKSVRRAGVPLVAIETADPQQTINAILRDLNGKQDVLKLMQWDIIRALTGLNDVGNNAVTALAGSEPKIATQNPTECLALLATAAEDTIVFWMNAQRYWGNETVMQGTWNLRDVWKSNGCTLVMLCDTAMSLPPELKNDVVVLTEKLPDMEEIERIVDSITNDAGVKNVEDKDKICDTLLGLSEFSAEQVLAMSITKEGIDREALWERKRKMIEQTPGLSVWRGGEKFDDVGGYENVKSFMRDISVGRAAPRSVVFIDEIEKSLAAGGTDSSGVSQDQLRGLLTYMQDKDAAGCIFIGPPGSGKSAVAKATGNEAGVPTISLDLGGLKGSLVGSSEARLRTALQVIEAVSQGRALFIATCNSIGVLPPELRRRFSLGTFFFPLPTAADRKLIWKLCLNKFDLTDKKLPADEGWTGAEIRNCCLIAWRLKRSLVEAAKFIVPVSVSAADQIDKLCRDAHNRYISADAAGLFQYSKLTQQPVSTGRRMEA